MLIHFLNSMKVIKKNSSEKNLPTCPLSVCSKQRFDHWVCIQTDQSRGSPVNRQFDIHSNDHWLIKTNYLHGLTFLTINMNFFHILTSASTSS